MTARSRWNRSARAVAGALVGGLTLVGAGMAGGCTPPAPSGATFDRAATVDEIVRSSNGTVDRGQAECFVNRVADEVGIEALAVNTSKTPTQIERLTSIQIDCLGLGNLGSVPLLQAPRGTRGPSDTSSRREPKRPGDDPQLDLLYAACQRGSGSSCDRLFDEAPVGSEYEEFASTCGGRTRELRCADKYPG